MKKERQTERERNSICPHCGKKDIVNKITRVRGEGSVSGNLFGFSGDSNTDTNEVNHCNNCGNQWYKYKIKYFYKKDILADWVNNLWYYFEKKYDWGCIDNTLRLLNDFHAESIWKIAKSVSGKVYDSTNSNLTLKLLKTKFKSIWKENLKN
jgi:transcription elongation factor Elf1